jgi:hypothetical protein
MNVICRECKWCKEINEKIRIRLSQENKEILNLLEISGYNLTDFCYCAKKGFIESLIAKKQCIDWEYKLE